MIPSDALPIVSPESLGKFAPDPAQSLIGLSVNDPRVPTPSFLIEDEKLEKNLERARARAVSSASLSVRTSRPTSRS